MELKLVRSRASELEADAVVVLEWEGPPRAGVREAARGASTVPARSRESFSNSRCCTASKATKRAAYLIAGAGKREKFDAAALRKIAGAAVRFLKGKGMNSARLRAGRRLDCPEHVAAAVEGAMLGVLGAGLPEDRQRRKRQTHRLDHHRHSERRTRPLEAALEKGRIIAEAANLSRDIAVEPPNLLTPLALADRARRMARSLRACPSRCSIRTACGSSAWARCSAWRREAPSRPR